MPRLDMHSLRASVDWQVTQAPKVVSGLLFSLLEPAKAEDHGEDSGQDSQDK